ncbi:UNVERIFIED_CONTAM: cytochrome [Sesamum latifolium]|uniref:Cytochrome n=1 Tax=Sesamum latifolium TaxID=2727402 RepID=A0AAW2X183_9LAMI
MDEFALAALTAFSLLASVLWYSWIFKKSKKGTTPCPPGPRGLPILGYLPFLQLNLHHQFAELAKKYGPIYKLQLGSKLTIVISSPALIKEVVRSRRDFCKSRPSRCSSNRHRWRRHRLVTLRDLLAQHEKTIRTRDAK